jgi:hypothetical protein
MEPNIKVCWNKMFDELISQWTDSIAEELIPALKHLGYVVSSTIAQTNEKDVTITWICNNGYIEIEASNTRAFSVSFPHQGGLVWPLTLHNVNNTQVADVIDFLEKHATD